MNSLLPVLITSIQAPTPSVEALLDAGHRVIVMGDRKSPPNEAYRRPGLEFHSIEDQVAAGGELVRLLPENSYARKNLGYLQLAREGFESFLETDDDNAPLPGWQETMAATSGVGTVRRIEGAGAAAFEPVNAYALFGQPEIWPRGFPLRSIRQTPSAPVESTLPEAPWIVQGLANGEPDVDAIFRLVFPGRAVEFAPGAPVVLAEGAWCPFNSQNTLWRRPALPLAYLPFTVPMRFTDILRGYIAQACLRAAGQAMVFTQASVFQDRNPHDPLRDFAGELDAYLRADEVMAALAELSLSGEPALDVVSCYECLASHKVVESVELDGVRAFLGDLDAAR